MRAVWQLPDLTVALRAADERLQAAWAETIGPAFLAESDRPDVELDLTLRDELPLPDTECVFQERRPDLPDGVGTLRVLASRRPEHVWLHFQEGALIEVPLTGRPASRISGYMTPKILPYGRFADAVFTSLAPTLRRHGYYYVHAFGACRDDRLLLLVGRSGSGKTTTGLTLALAGWQMLANDLVLLTRRDDRVWGFPMPGHVSVRQQTLNLLPQLRGDHYHPRWNPYDDKWHISADSITTPLPAGGPVTDVAFPAITGRTARRDVPQALALARLMEESVDRWDAAALPGHVDLLQFLCRTAAVFELTLAEDVARLPALFDR